MPEIQAMINRIPIPDPEITKCDYRTGWFPSEFDARCREIVSNLVAAEIKRQMFEQQKQKKRQQVFSHRKIYVRNGIIAIVCSAKNRSLTMKPKRITTKITKMNITMDRITTKNIPVKSKKIIFYEQKSK